MSRVANAPVELPSGVEVKLNGQDVSVKGGKGELSLAVHNDVELSQEEGMLKVAARNQDRGAIRQFHRCIGHSRHGLLLKYRAQNFTTHALGSSGLVCHYAFVSTNNCHTETTTYGW